MKCRLKTLCTFLVKGESNIRLQPISFKIIMISNNFLLLVLGYTCLFWILLEIHIYFVLVYMIIFCKYNTRYADISHQQHWVQIAVLPLLPHNLLILTCYKICLITNSPFDLFEGYIGKLQIYVLSIWIISISTYW